MAAAAASSAPAAAAAAAAAGSGAGSGAAAAALKAELWRHGRDPDAAVDEGVLADLLCGVDLGISRGEVETLLAHVSQSGPEHLTFAKLVDFIFDAIPENQQDPHADGGFLGPASARRAADPPRLEPGAQIQQRRENEDTKYKVWLASVSVPERYHKIPYAIQDAAERGICVEQLESLGGFVQEVRENSEVVKNASITDRDGVLQTWLAVNLYTICDFFVNPLTKDSTRSFLERLAFSKQVPIWFISHFGGTPFRESLRMLCFHCEQRGLGLDAYYWLCTFANNQHNLSELAGGLADTPFMRVLRSTDCKGTVALMDSAAWPFRRVWCILECYASMMRKFYYNIAAWVPEGLCQAGGRDSPEQAALQLDEGNFRVREVTESEYIFPTTVAAEGVKKDITKAQASVQADYDAIMRHVKGSVASLNSAVRRRFAPAAMYGAALLGDAAQSRGLLGDFPESKDAASAQGNTPALRAAYGGHAEVLKALAEAGADLNRAQQAGAMPVLITAQKSSIEALKVLVRAGADLNKAKTDGFTPALIAAEKGQTEVLKVLVKARADLDKTSRDGTRLAWMAAQKGHAQVLRVLAEARADLQKADNAGVTPANIAKRMGRTEALAVLREASAAGES